MELKDIIDNLYEQAQHMNACDKFKGNETLEEIVRLFLSPQGLEFCFNNHFPNLASLRAFKAMGVDKYGIYIDAGEITLNNPKQAMLIGRTSATINCDTLERHHVILFHGAKAMVNASKWAVVFTKVENGCLLIRNSYDNSIIL